MAENVIIIQNMKYNESKNLHQVCVEIIKITQTSDK